MKLFKIYLHSNLTFSSSSFEKLETVDSQHGNSKHEMDDKRKKVLMRLCSSTSSSGYRTKTSSSVIWRLVTYSSLFDIGRFIS